MVNEFQPDTKWTSLGEIARHSHLIRRREDGGFDVWMLANEADLTNPTDQDAVFHIQKKEDRSAKILAVTIDGSTATLERSGEVLTSLLEIPAHQERRIRVAYQNDLDVARVDIRKNNLHAYVLRRISDFRDLHLSRSSWGNVITQAYYHHGWNAVDFLPGKKMGDGTDWCRAGSCGCMVPKIQEMPPVAGNRFSTSWRMTLSIRERIFDLAPLATTLGNLIFRFM